MGNKVTSKITGNTVEVLRGTSRKVTLRNPVSKQIWTVAAVLLQNRVHSSPLGLDNH